MREVLTRYLTHDAFDVIDAADGEEAIAAVDSGSFDLVLLDLMLPKRHGLEVLAHIRDASDLPVILLTALGEEPDRIAGLEQGADDYVVKPFSPREVVARVRSVLRRSHRTEDALPAHIEFGNVIVDVGRREISVAGDGVELTRLEFDLLVFLAVNPSQVLTRDELLQAVWGSSVDWQDPATVTVHLRRLRQKLEADPSDPQHLLTAYGLGYRFEP